MNCHVSEKVSHYSTKVEIPLGSHTSNTTPEVYILYCHYDKEQISTRHVFRYSLMILLTTFLCCINHNHWI
jgi:hypothetical protein